MPEVIVAIPTFRRPRMLERLLRALEVLETGATVRILVADNDAERHEGFDLCRLLLAQGYKGMLDPFIAPERGIAQVRNALVARALGYKSDFIAMLDDDEWPEPGWLDAFLAVQQQTGADALHGAVLRAFDSAPGVLAAECDGISDLRGVTGPVDMIEGTGNVIFRTACFAEAAKPCFDPAFALSGGEDRDFFVRLKRQGRSFAWADEAVVHAHVPETRANLKWALARAYRVGNSDMRVFLKHKPRFAEMARELAKIGGAFAVYPVLLVIPRRSLDALRKLCRAAGKVAAMFGLYYNEYAVTHGA